MIQSVLASERAPEAIIFTFDHQKPFKARSSTDRHCFVQFLTQKRICSILKLNICSICFVQSSVMDRSECRLIRSATVSRFYQKQFKYGRISLNKLCKLSTSLKTCFFVLRRQAYCSSSTKALDPDAFALCHEVMDSVSLLGASIIHFQFGFQCSRF